MDTDFAKEEKRILKFWKDNKIFEKSLSQRKKGKIFNFFDGPPFATGSPHYGHILASTIKDVIPRYWAMKGYFVPRRWGWDCHGLPIENIVEKKLNISGKKQIEEIGVGKFNKTCQENVLTYTKEWGKMVGRIGRFIDFKNSYKTMDNNYIESVWWAIKEIYKKGLIYQGRKVLLYCPRCECPISNFEVAMDNSYKDLQEESITVKFKIKNAKKALGISDKNLYFLAWTTTPWTLPANQALAIAKSLNYILVKQNKEFYILSESRKEILGKDFQILKKFKGKDLLGLEYEPLYKTQNTKPQNTNKAQNPKTQNTNTHKILLGEFVTAEEGTGIVHIAPVYGEDDYKLGLENNLPIIPLLNSKGVFNKQAPDFIQGEYFKKADKLIKDDLDKGNIIYKKEQTIHSYPFCWRCNTALFYSAIPAWFINIQKIKKRLIELNKKINWYPSHLKQGRFQKGIETAPDWTISRNRYWASPLPIWKCAGCENLEVIGSKKDLLKQKFTTNKYFILRHGHSCRQKKNIVVCWPEKIVCPLTDKGRKQIQNAAKKLANKKIDIIYASDLLRTKQTAEIVAKKLGIGIKYDLRLRELNLGVYNGKPSVKFREDFPNRNELSCRRPKNGENWADCQKRTLNFIKDINKKHKNKNILIVSHGDPLWLLELAMKGYDNKQVLEQIEQKIQRNYLEPGGARQIDFKVFPYNEKCELDFHRPYIDNVKFSCPKCGKKMERIPEVLDCWVESASMPFAELHYPFENKKYFEKRFPAQFVSEYIAQTRAWFYVMHAISCILFDKPPFENVVATGTILNEKGEKLSKSKKNFPDPELALEKYGADALRFYLISSSVMKGEDLYFSEQELKENYQKVILLLLNIFSFYKEYQTPLPLSSVAKPVRNASPASNAVATAGWHSDAGGPKHILDKWILSRLNCLKKHATENMDNYDVVSTTREIKNFINDFSVWYLRRSRDRFKKGDKQGIKVFGFVLFELSKIMAPITPFIAEHIYQRIKGKKQSVHLEDWPACNACGVTTAGRVKIDKKFIDEELEQKMDTAREIVTQALSQRAKAEIKTRQPLENFQFSISNFQSIFNFQLEKEFLDLIQEEINVKNIKQVVKENLPEGKNWISTKENDIWTSLDTKITTELKEEGIVRDVIRQIQGMRKKAGYKPKHRILVRYSGTKQLNAILMRNKNFIVKELRADDFLAGDRPKRMFNIERETKIDNQKLWLGIRKI